MTLKLLKNCFHYNGKLIKLIDNNNLNKKSNDNSTDDLSGNDNFTNIENSNFNDNTTNNDYFTNKIPLTMTISMIITIRVN